MADNDADGYSRYEGSVGDYLLQLEILSEPTEDPTPGSPEISVWADANGYELNDGSGIVDFGQTDAGVPVGRTFTIHNLGDADLMLDSEALLVPDGFSVTTMFAGTVAAGDSTSFALQFDATSTGTYAGEFSLATNDPDEDPFSFTVSGEVLEASPDASFQLALTNDTGAFNDDLLTADPRVSGNDSGNFGEGSPTIEVDLDADGIADTTVNVNESGEFTYDPRDDDAALATHEGPVTLGHRLIVVNPDGSTTVVQDWTDFTFTLVNSAELVRSVDLVDLQRVIDEADPDQNTSSHPRIRGTVALDGNAALADVSVQYDLWSDGIVDAVVPTVGNSGFLIDLSNRLSEDGPVTVDVRAVAYDPLLATSFESPWQTLGFTYAKPQIAAPVIADLEVESADGAANNEIRSDATLTGTVLRDGTAVSFATVQYDLDADGTVDGEATAGINGTFAIAIGSSISAATPQDITVKVRAGFHSISAAGEVFGDWQDLTFSYTPTVIGLPEIHDLGLESDIGAPDAAATSDPMIIGRLVIPGGSLDFAEIEFDVDGDGIADGSEDDIDPETGEFSLDLGEMIQAGQVSVAVRGIGFNTQAEEYESGAWYELGFAYAPVTASIPEILNVHLVNDTGVPNDGATSDARLAGLVSRAGGSLDGIQIHYDLDGDGIADGQTYTGQQQAGQFVIELNSHELPSGQVSLNLRASILVEGLARPLTSDWQAFTFEYETWVLEPPRVTSLELANDTGLPGDGVTSVPSLVGTAERADGTAANLYIQYDLDDDDIADGTVLTDPSGNGVFRINLDPQLLVAGAIVVRTRAGQWSEETDEFVYGDWESLSFEYQQDSPSSPEVTGLHLVNDTDVPDDGVTSDARIAGSVTSSGLSGNNLPVQFDINGDGVAEGFTNTAVSGAAEFTFDLNTQPLADGPVEIWTRAGTLDAGSGEYVYGEWETFSFTYQAAALTALPTVTGLQLRDDTDVPDDNITSKPVVVGNVTAESGSLVALPVEFDVDGDGSAEGVAYTDGSGTGAFTLNLRDWVITEGPVTVNVRAAVLDPGSGALAYGEWSSFDFEYELDPLEQLGPPPAPPAPPTEDATLEHFAYVDYLGGAFDALSLEYDSSFVVGSTIGYPAYVAGGHGGQMALFADPFSPHADGTVDTVVAGDYTDTDSYTDESGGNYEVDTIVLSTLTTDAETTSGGAWTLNQILASSYTITTEYTGPEGATYVLVQSGFHNYTFASSGDDTGAAYDLNESRADTFTHTREADSGLLTLEDGSLQTVTVSYEGAGDQGFTFVAEGEQSFAADGTLTTHQLETYESYAQVDEEKATETTLFPTDGPPVVLVTPVLWENFSSSFDYSREVTVAAGLVTTAYTWNHDTSETEGSTFTEGSVDVHVDGDAETTTIGDWINTSTETNTYASGGTENTVLDSASNSIIEEARTYAWSGSEEETYYSWTHYDSTAVTNSVGVSRTVVSLDTQEDFSREIDAYFGTATLLADGVYESTETTRETYESQSTYDRSIDDTYNSSDSYVDMGSNHSAIHEVETEAGTYGYIDVHETTHNYYGDGTTDTLETWSSIGGSGLSESDLVDEFYSSSSPGVASTSNSHSLETAVTTSNHDNRWAKHWDTDGVLRTWESDASVTHKDFAWTHAYDAQVNGTSIVPGGTVSYTTSTESSSNGTGTQNHRFSDYEESDVTFHYDNVVWGASGQFVVIMAGYGDIPLNYESRDAAIAGHNQWQSSSTSSADITDTSVARVGTHFTASEESTDEGSADFAATMTEKIANQDPSTLVATVDSASSYSGEFTWSSERNSTSVGVAYPSLGITTVTNTELHSSASGEGTYDGTTSGTGSTIGTVSTSDYYVEDNSESTSEALTTTFSEFESHDTHEIGVTRESTSTTSSIDESETESESQYNSHDRLNADGGVVFTATSTSTSTTEGDVSGQTDASSTATGTVVEREGVTSTFDNSSTSGSSFIGQYTSIETSAINTLNELSDTREDSSYTEQGDTTSYSTSTSSSFTEDVSGGDTTTYLTSNSSASAAGTGTYSNTETSFSESLMDGSSHYGETSEYDTTGQGTRSSTADNLRVTFGAYSYGPESPWEPGDRTTTDSGSIVSTATTESADYTSHDYGSKSTLDLVTTSDDYSEWTEVGDFTLSTSANDWSQTIEEVNSTSNGVYTFATATTDESSYSTRVGDGTFTSSDTTEEHLLADGIETFHSVSESTRDESGDVTSGHSSSYAKSGFSTTSTVYRVFSESSSSQRDSTGEYASQNSSTTTTTDGATSSETIDEYSEEGDFTTSSHSESTNDESPRVTATPLVNATETYSYAEAEADSEGEGTYSTSSYSLLQTGPDEFRHTLEELETSEDETGTRSSSSLRTQFSDTNVTEDSITTDSFAYWMTTNSEEGTYTASSELDSTVEDDVTDSLATQSYDTNGTFEDYTYTLNTSDTTEFQDSSEGEDTFMIISDSFSTTERDGEGTFQTHFSVIETNQDGLIVTDTLETDSTTETGTAAESGTATSIFIGKQDVWAEQSEQLADVFGTSSSRNGSDGNYTATSNNSSHIVSETGTNESWYESSHSDSEYNESGTFTNKSKSERTVMYTKSDNFPYNVVNVYKSKTKGNGIYSELVIHEFDSDTDGTYVTYDYSESTANGTDTWDDRSKSDTTIHPDSVGPATGSGSTIRTGHSNSRDRGTDVYQTTITETTIEDMGATPDPNAPQGTTTTEEHDSNSFGTSRFLEHNTSEASKAGARQDEPLVWQQYTKKGQEFSKGNGIWVASDYSYAVSRPGGQFDMVEEHTLHEVGTIRWDDWTTNNERAEDYRDLDVEIVLTATDKESDKGHGTYVKDSHSNVEEYRLNASDPGARSVDEGSSETLTRHGVKQSVHTKTETKTGEFSVELPGDFFEGVPVSGPAGIHIRSLEDSTTTTSDAQKHTYTQRDTGDTLETWGDVWQHDVTVDDHVASLSYGWDEESTIASAGIETYLASKADVTLASRKKTTEDATGTREYEIDGSETRYDEKVAITDESISGRAEWEQTVEITDTSTPDATIVDNFTRKSIKEGTQGTIEGSSGSTDLQEMIDLILEEDETPTAVSGPPLIGFSGQYVELTERTENSSHYEYTSAEQTSGSDSSGWQEHSESIQRFTQDYDDALSGPETSSMYYNVPQGDHSTVTDSSHSESHDWSTQGTNWTDSTYQSDEYRQTIVDFNVTPDFSAGSVGGGGTLTETYVSGGASTNESHQDGATNTSSSEWHNSRNSTAGQDVEGTVTLVAYAASSSNGDQSSSSDGTSSTSVSKAASELEGALSDVAQFLVGGWIEYATSDLESLEVYEVPEPPKHYEGIFDWVGQKVVLPMVGEERLLAGGRFGNGLLDDLMIAGLLATEIVAYVDPTPVSDLLNAGLNAADGNYADAALSLGGALIPGGGDKGVRAGAKIGGKVADGFSDGVKAVGKRVNCQDANPLFRAAGKAMGKCFVGDTQVVLDFAPEFGEPVHATATQVEEGDSGFQISDNTLLFAGVGAVALGVTGAAILAKRRRKRETERALDQVMRMSTWIDEDYDPDSNLDRCFESMPEDFISQFVDDQTPYGDGASLQPAYQQREVPALTADSPTATAVQTLPSTPRRSSGVTRANLSHARSTTRTEPSARTKAPSVRAKQNLWSKPLLWLMPWLLIAAGCFGLALFNNDVDTHSTATSAAPVDTSHLTTRTLPAKNTGKYLTCDIRDLPVAVWILADNPETEGNLGFDYSELDPSELRILRLRMEKPDGGLLNIRKLAVAHWLKTECIAPTSKVHVEYEELGIAGAAEVIDVLPCPPIPARPSQHHCLVITTFEHSAASIIDLQVDYTPESIGVTANHPTWSEDRQDFVAAGDLRVGETLLTADGTVTRVVSTSSRIGKIPVYNLEVDGEHVYFVSGTGILVHNAKQYSEALERFGSKAEALQAKATQALHPQGPVKRLALPGAVNPKKLGKRKTYSHRISIEADKGTTKWLRANNLKDQILGHDPDRVFAIPNNLLDELNRRIRKITIDEL